MGAASELPGIPEVTCKDTVFVCHQPQHIMGIAPWGSLLQPYQIDAMLQKSWKMFEKGETMFKKSEDVILTFVGTIWQLNAKEFIDFSNGCSRAKIHWWGRQLFQKLEQMPGWNASGNI